MKVSALALTLVTSLVAAKDASIRGRKLAGHCPHDDIPKSMGIDNSERFLLREGIIDSIPKSLCDTERPQKNVILVVGDGMGWEMIRAGAIAKMVVNELEGMGVNIVNGTSGDDAEKAMDAFKGRSLSDYYTKGQGHGLSFQELPGHVLMTTTTTVNQEPNDGDHYAPAQSLLEGSVSGHDDGMAPLALDECGDPIDFDPRDFEEEGGNMVMYNTTKGGQFPWSEQYYRKAETLTPGFDLEYIMRHATDSASTAGCMATGTKAAVNMMSVDLYEEKSSTLVEDAMMCGKAAGVISSVPILHATPGAFVVHSNYRKNGSQMQRSFASVNPTFAGGTCISRYQPSEEFKEAIMNGNLKDMWTFIHTDPEIMAEDFFEPIKDKHPDNGDHVLMCMGGQYSASRQSNMPYRGLDSDYKDRYCSSSTVIRDENEVAVGVNVTTSEEPCNHYDEEEVKHIPSMKEAVKEAIEFLGKDKDGFFFMYEQGDIDWAAHGNHMDDMLGTMLDIDEGVREIMNWVKANGGWAKNALYVTADHDHYLTLEDNFPEALATLIIKGESYKITPRNNSGRNPWSTGIGADRHEDDSKSVTDHISDFTTWLPTDVDEVGHFWGAKGSGGNGWGSHSTRPVPLSFHGDEGCLYKLKGAGFRVLGKEVEGTDNMVDQMHLHACMLKNLFGL